MHLFSALLIALQAAVVPDTAHVVIVATTDVHGRVFGWDYVRDAAAPGGLSRAATALETLRARYPGQVVLVDAGDLLQGNPFATFFGHYDKRQPQPIVDAMNALQYDVITPGNHDFDFGVDFLRRAASQATYRYVSANVEDSSGGSLFPKTVILPRGAVKVGITGFTTPGTMLWDRAQLAAGHVRVRRIAGAAPSALARLEGEGADLKVVVIHSGFGESSYDTAGVGAENDAAALASVNPKPDLVIVGHTHREVRDTVVNGVHFVQPKNWAQSLAVVHVSLARDSTRRFRVTAIRPELIPLGNVAESPRFTQRLTAAHEAARLWAGTLVGSAGPGFDARYIRVQDTPLLDFINEVQRRRAGAQLSAAAAFDVQPGLPEGDLHQRDVAGIYPYENTLRAVKISGQQLREYLEHSARYFRTYETGGGQPILNDSVAGYNYDVVSGVAYNIDLSRPAGQRIRGLAFNGKIVQPTDTFTLALNSYRQAGGGGYSMLAKAPVIYDKGEDIRALLVDEIRRARTIQAATYLRPSWAIIPDSARAAARAAFAPAAARISTRDSTLLRVLTTSDLHGQLEPRVWEWSQNRPVGGVAALKSWIDSLANACRCASVRLDAGDEMQGTALSNATFGRGTIDALNAIGIDAAAIGNHEFDWSIDTLRARMTQAKYPFLSANITNTAGTARPDWATPWKLVTKSGVKIAVIGLTTTETPTSTASRNIQGLAFGDGAQAIKRYLPEARAAADFVIVVAHVGALCDSSTGGGNASCHGEILDVARQLDSGSVDLIVAGHTHARVNTVVHGIPIVEAQSSGRSVGIVDFVRTSGRREVRVQLVTPYADQVRPDVALTDALGRQQQAVRNITERVVARMKVPLRRAGDEYALGRLIADAQRTAGRADVAIMNNGGIRADLPEGTINWGQVYQVQPFQNRLQRLTVKGSVLEEALEQCVAGRDHMPDCHIAGAEVWFDGGKEPGKRVSRVHVNGKDLDKGRTYTLVVSDFMATGGSGFRMLAGSPREDIDVIDIDALTRYLGVLRAPVEAPDDVRFHRTDR
jgi:2',3'-cyclic-nucleotide 2'-phosphodiesterase / 3'-nucleotidase / 5'-nucleotidase